MSWFCSTIHDYSDCSFFVNKNSIVLLFGCSTSSCLCFRWSKWYFIVISRILLQFIPSSIYYSFNHKIPLLSTIVSTRKSFLSYWYLFIHIVYSTEFSGFSISSLISLYFPHTLWIICQSIKSLEKRASIVSNLLFPNNTILSCSFFCFLIIDLYLLIHAVSAVIFNPTAKLVMPIGTNEVIPNKVIADIETQPVIIEDKISKWSTKFKYFYVFLCFSLIKSLCFTFF